MRLPWTLELIRDLSGSMDLPSILRLRSYLVRVAKTGGVANTWLSLDMRRPIRGRIFLRERGSDFSMFKEVIDQQVYSSVPMRLPKCRSIIDLGANIGLASLYFSAQFPDAQLLSVEPNEDSFRVLLANLQPLIKAGRCRTLKAAVWSANRVLVADASRGADHYSAFAAREPADNTVVGAPISGMTMSQIIAESGFSSVDLVKVDIEGAEVELFKGDCSWLQQVRAIAIEFHDGSRSTSGFDRIMDVYQFRILNESSHTILAIKKA